MDKSGEAYWKAVLTLIAQVLAVWFFVSFGCGILFADAFICFFFKQKTAYEISEWTGVQTCALPIRSEEHTSELQSHSEISYAVFCLRSKEHTTKLQSHSEISYAVFSLRKKENTS